MAEKDITEKTLISLNDVFADIVNGLLFHGKQVLKEEALIDAQPLSTYRARSALRMQERDVAKYWISETGEHIGFRIAFLGIENQTEYDKDMVFRVLGYDGAAYRDELNQKDRYPVVTIVLYFGNERWGKNRTIYDAVEIPEELRPYVSDYHINVFEVAHLKDEEIERFHSDFRIAADFFAHRRTDPNYRPKDPVKFRHVDELLNLMAAVTNDDRYVDILDIEGRKSDNMDEYLDRLLAKGRAEGEIKGRAEGITMGRAEGIMEGELIGKLKTLANLVKNGLLSLTNAAKEMDLSPEEFQKKVAELAAEK